MRLVVFGANGGIGKNVVMQALEAGHQVTAVARRPETITLKHERLTVLRGDVFDVDCVAQPVAGQDVVVSTVGVVKNEPTTLYSQAAANMLHAMQANGVQRFFCISATGLNPGSFFQSVIAKPLLWRFFGHSYADLVRMETVVEASPLDWTIVRPPRLTDARRTGKYRVSVNRMIGTMTISRADVGDFIVNHLTDAATYRAVVEIGY